MAANATPVSPVSPVSTQDRINDLYDFDITAYKSNPLFEKVSHDEYLLKCAVLFNNFDKGEKQKEFNKIIEDKEIIQYLYDELPSNIKKSFDLIKPHNKLGVYYSRLLVCYYICE